jgi:hypothetical protein
MAGYTHVVMHGAAEFTVGGQTFAAPAGTLVLVRDPALVRVARATEDGTTVLCVGGVPGGAYAPLEWEGRAIAEPRG